jgi:Divergent InlB B-repeat domain
VGPILGTVTSVPAGINCGLDCVQQTASFPSGTLVTLAAQSIPGASFSHWTGDCSGSSNPCAVTMNADKTVVAHFQNHPRPGDAGTTGSPAQELLRSRLIASGGRGEVIADGRTTSVPGGVEIVIALDSRTADVVVEGWVRESAGEGVWRFSFEPATAAGRSIRNVFAGEPVTLTPDTVVFRVKGKLPQRIAFVVRLRREQEFILPAP